MTEEPSEQPRPEPELSNPGRSGETKQPWWNDGDLVGGMAGTIIVLGLALSVALMLLGGAWWVFNLLVDIG